MRRLWALLHDFVNNPLVALNGVREFRSPLTTHYEDYDLLCSYDAGREIAHIVTLRHFEENQ